MDIDIHDMKGHTSILCKLGATGNQPLNGPLSMGKATAIKSLTKPKSSKDDYQLLERWEQVIIFRLRTGHSRLKSHMARCTVTDSRVHPAVMPAAGANEKECGKRDFK